MDRPLEPVDDPDYGALIGWEWEEDDREEIG